MRYGKDEATGQQTVFDPLRRRWVVATPEEMVRQHFVDYLAKELGYPMMLMANEVGIKLNGTLKRCDTVVWHPSDPKRPLMIVEYKAPTVKLSAKVFEQISRYCVAIGARYLTVSNGLRTCCCRVGEQGEVKFLSAIPRWQAL